VYNPVHNPVCNLCVTIGNKGAWKLYTENQKLHTGLYTEN